MRKPIHPIPIVFDGLILVLVLIWLGGGVPYGERMLLTHGADPRRAAVALGLLGWLSKLLRERSFWLRAARAVGARLHSGRFRWRLWILATAFAAVLGLMQTLALRYPLYDVGIFHQILWSIHEGLGFHSTISGAGNFLLDHLSPSLALLSPFFGMTGSSPLTLPFLHAVLIFIGIAGWMRFAERLDGGRGALSAAVPVFALCFDSLWGNLRWGFHENSIYFAAMSWAVPFLILDLNRFLTLILLVIAAGSKEILLLNVGIAFLAWSVRDLRRRESWTHIAFGSISVAIAASLFAVFVLFERLPHPADKNYFIRYYSYLGSGLGEFLQNLILDPGLIIREVGAGELLRYAKTVFLPFLGLPLLWIAWLVRPDALMPASANPAPRSAFIFPTALLLVIGPSVASAALATYPPLRQPGFHYVLELWVILVPLTLLALARLKRVRLIWTWALFSLLMLGQDPWGDLWEYSAESSRVRSVRERLAEIPAQASVVADELAGTWVSSRRLITRWPKVDEFGAKGPEWIVLRDKTLPPEWLGRGYELEWNEGAWSAYRRPDE